MKNAAENCGAAFVFNLLPGDPQSVVTSLPSMWSILIEG